MAFSISFLLILTIMSLDDISKKKVFKFLWPLIFMILSYGIASKVYQDEYRKFYFLIEDNIGSLENFWKIFFEKGWVFAIYTKFANTLNLGPILYIMIPSFVSLMIQKNFFYKHSNLPVITLFFFFSHGFIVRESVTIRSAIVASIIIILISSLCEKKNLKFYIYLFIATGIHYLAILAGLLIFLKKLLFPYKYILIIIFTFTCSFLGLPKLILTLVGQKFSIVDIYLNSFYANPITFDNPKLIQQIGTTFFLIFVIKNYRREIIDNSILVVSINAYILSTILFIFFKDFGIFAFRSAGMFSVVEPLIIVFILTKLFKKKSSWFIGIIICILIFLVNYLLLNRNAIYNNDKSSGRPYSERLR